MHGTVADTRVSLRKKATRTVRPILEGLEDRRLLYATFNGTFAYGSRITYSFMPDTTNLGGATSNLISTLDGKFSRTAWQNAFARAAASWSAIANINLVQVSDNGATLGSGSYQQGDPNMGDIRIGGYAQGSSTLAWAFRPPPANGNSAAGDIFFNTNLAWQINSDYDLQTVAMHEFGHALGLDHSAVTSAEMYPYYDGLQQTLTTDDIAGIQSVWGTRAPDWTSQGGGNSTQATAYNAMNYYYPSIGQVVLTNLNITGPNDFHWYKVTTPSGVSSFSATIQTSGLSLLQGRVQIYSASGTGLVQTYGTFSPTGSVTTATFTNAQPNTTYYIRTGPGASGPASAGAYALIVNMGNQSNYFVQPPYTQVGVQASQGGGSSSMSNGAERFGSPASAENSNGFDDDSGVIRIGSVVGLGDAMQVKPRTTHPKSHRFIGFKHPRGAAKQFGGRVRGLARFAGRAQLTTQA